MNNQNLRITDSLKLGKLEIAGRLFKAATAETSATDDGFVTDELLKFYEPIAYAKTPLIISGNMYVELEGKSTYKCVGIDNDDKIEGLKKWTRMVTKYNSKIFAQLNHGGRQVFRRKETKVTVSASNVREKSTMIKPKPLRLDEIKRIINSYGNAALRAQESGFHGVQIHAGHGYLINQFLTPYTNHRKDNYGGNLKNRMHFLIEIYQNIREKVGQDYPIIMKMNGTDSLSQKGLSINDYIEIGEIMQEEGIDAIEVTKGHYESGMVGLRGNFNKFYYDYLNYGVGNELPFYFRFLLKNMESYFVKMANKKWGFEEAFNLSDAQLLKKALSIPVICVGGFNKLEIIEEAIKSKKCDAVSMARPFVGDPFLFKNFQQGKKEVDCGFCNQCIARAGNYKVDCYSPKVKSNKEKLLRKNGF